MSSPILANRPGVPGARTFLGGNMNKQFSLSAVLLAASVAASNAFAAAQTYTGITTDITAEITAAMPVVLAVGGSLLGIGVAFRLIRRAGKF